MYIRGCMYTISIREQYVEMEGYILIIEEMHKKLFLLSHKPPKLSLLFMKLKKQFINY